MNRAVLFGVVLITALHAFDELVLVISMPTIAAELGSGDAYGLSIASYVLASIIGMTWAGQTIDRRGPQRVLALGLAVFAAGLLVAAAAWNTGTFIAGRLLQGLGGGVGWTTAFALINLLFNREDRSRALTAMDVGWVCSSVSAPFLGALLIDWFHWRWLFVLQMIPLCVVAILVLPRIRILNRSGAVSDTGLLIDALRIAIGVGLTLYAIAQPAGAWWLAAPLGFAIAWHPYNRKMPASWWRGIDPLAYPILIALISFLAFYGMEAFQPLFLMEFRQVSTVQAGLVLTSSSVAWLLGSYLASRWQQTLPRPQMMAIGNLLLLTGIVALGVSSMLMSSLVAVYGAWAIAGLGMGLTFNAARTEAMAQSPRNQEGFTATAITLASNMGIGLAAGIGGSIKNQVLLQGGDLQLVMLGITFVGAMACIYGVAVHWLRSAFKSTSTLATPSSDDV